MTHSVGRKEGRKEKRKEGKKNVHGSGASKILHVVALTDALSPYFTIILKRIQDGFQMQRLTRVSLPEEAMKKFFNGFHVPYFGSAL